MYHPLVFPEAALSQGPEVTLSYLKHTNLVEFCLKMKEKAAFVVCTVVVDCVLMEGRYSSVSFLNPVFSFKVHRSFRSLIFSQKNIANGLTTRVITVYLFTQHEQVLKRL